MAEQGLLDRGVKIRPMTLPDQLIHHDSPDKQYEDAGLTAPAIVETVLKALGRTDEKTGLAEA